MFLDLDGTLWDHEDISQLHPPFQKIDDLTIVDSKGVRVRVYELMMEIMRRAAENGFILSTLSWNNPEIALQALSAFRLRDSFHYHAIEDHPRKDILALKALRHFMQAFGCDAFKVVYIDDREIHLDDMLKVLPEACFIRAHRDFSNISEAFLRIKKCIEDKGIIVLDG
ncbi:MAG: magnesium-dependent phosphatase-1 [Thermosphaera sp.]